MTDSKTDLTRLLLDWRNGDQQALNELTPKVIEELRRIASGFLRKERQEHTLQPTALVNEVYLRLVDSRQVDWQSRAHFVNVAACQMRRILVDHAREHNAKKRGGDDRRTFVELDLIPQSPDVDLIDLDRALSDLVGFNPEGSRIVELRFFGGLTNEEVAEVLGIGLTTVKRRWNVARLWLRRELSGATASSLEEVDSNDS